MEGASMFQGLRTVSYNVSDVEQAKAWYTRVVGYGPYFDEPYYVGFNIGGYELGLIPDGARLGEGGVTVYWGVQDARGELARLVELGARPHSEIRDVGEGILVTTVLDPFGNVLGIIENPHFKVEE
jgi:predicted enzyme related to lactoylglutathione lyase